MEKLKTSNEISKEYESLSSNKKLNILYDALDYMQQYNGRSKFLCIAMAMGYVQDSDSDSLNNYKKIK